MALSNEIGDLISNEIKTAAKEIANKANKTANEVIEKGGKSIAKETVNKATKIANEVIEKGGKSTTKETVNKANEIAKQISKEAAKETGGKDIKKLVEEARYKRKIIEEMSNRQPLIKEKNIQIGYNPRIDSAYNDYRSKLKQKMKNKDKKQKTAAELLNHKWTKTAIGLGVGAFALSSVFGNKGQQTNAQLYGQQQQQY